MIRSSLCLGASCQPWEEQPLQPCHQNVNLRHVGVKEFGGDSRTERPAGDLLPCEPGVDDGFGLGELREAFFGRGNPRHTGLDVGEQAAAGRDQEAEKIFEDAAGLVVRHDPHTNPRQQTVGRRGENGACGSRMGGNILIPRLGQPVVKGLPAGRKVGVGIYDYTERLNVALLEPNGKILQQPQNVSLGFDFVELADTAFAADVFQDMLVVAALHEKNLLARHIILLRFGHGSRRQARPRGTELG